MKNKVRPAGKNIPVGILVGWIVSVLITVLSAAVVAWLIAGEYTQVTATEAAAFPITMLAAAIGSFAAALTAGDHFLIAGMATGGAYFLSLLSITALVFDGQYEKVWLTLLSIIAGSLVASLVTLRLKTPGRVPKFRYRR